MHSNEIKAFDFPENINYLKQNEFSIIEIDLF